MSANRYLVSAPYRDGRLDAQGKPALYHWIETRYATLDAVRAATPDAVVVSPIAESEAAEYQAAGVEVL